MNKDLIKEAMLTHDEITKFWRKEVRKGLGSWLDIDDLLEAQLYKAKLYYGALVENTLRDFSDIQREAGHPESYWAGYHYARNLILAALEGR